jgi:hypothetical protein
MSALYSRWAFQLSRMPLFGWVCLWCGDWPSPQLRCSSLALTQQLGGPPSIPSSNHVRGIFSDPSTGNSLSGTGQAHQPDLRLPLDPGCLVIICVSKWCECSALGLGLRTHLGRLGCDQNCAGINTWPHPRGVTFVITRVALGGGVAAQVYRYRVVSESMERQQTKWFVYSLVIVLLAFALSLAPEYLFPSVREPGAIHVLYLITRNLVFQLSLILAPIALTVPILRYRLWEVDFIINRSLVYGALTVLLLALLGISLYVISLALKNMAGGSLVAVASSALWISASTTSKSITRKHRLSL